jgi:citrate lyase beta subunit
VAPDVARPLRLRTNLLVPAAAAGGIGATLAEAVTIDYSTVTQPGTGDRGLAALEAVAGRPTHIRIAIDRRLGIEASLEADLSQAVGAVLLGGVDRPQDVRDADVALRRREMRLGLEPGTVRLISEVGSALALRALPRMFEAVDRHSAVALTTDTLAADLQLPGAPHSHLGIHEYAMAEVAIAARVAGVPWLLLAPILDTGTRSMLATRAHAHGASGVYITSEPEAQGFNSLFAPLG